MHALSVNPDSSLKAYQDLAKVYSAIEPPTWALLLAELLRFRDEAWQKYFTNPAYLDLVECRFRLQEKRNVEDMASISLKRKILRD